MHSSNFRSIMKKVAISLVAMFFMFGQVSATVFSDVPDEHQNATAIAILYSWSIISGYGDGTFRPDNLVNRAEALKIILTSAGVESPEITNQSDIMYSDITLADWFAKYVVSASKHGIVGGNPDGSFAPGREVNKAEYIKMVLEAFGVDVSAHNNAGSISSDTQGGEWFIPYLSYAKTVGIISPTLDNKLNPAESINRGESAEIVYKMIVVLRGGDAQKLISIAESNLVYVLVHLNNDDIEEALKYADSATFYTEKVLAISPEDTIAQGADKTARAFKELCLAYQAGLQSQSAALSQHVKNAKSFGDAAVAADSSFSEFRDYIDTAAGALLLSQL